MWGRVKSKGESPCRGTRLGDSDEGDGHAFLLSLSYGLMHLWPFVCVRSECPLPLPPPPSHGPGQV